MNYRNHVLNRLVQISLDLANIIDQEGSSKNNDFLTKGLGLGYRALSGYLRDGVKEIVNMQEKCSRLNFQKELAENSEKDAKKFLDDIFGDEDIDNVNDELKALIKDYVNTLLEGGI